MDRQFLVEIKDKDSTVRHKVWVISSDPDNMQGFIEDLHRKHQLPWEMLSPVVVSVEEKTLRTIRLQLIDRIFPVLK